jgi:histidinol-phosphate aminotransferase
VSIVERAPAYVRAISPYQPGKPISELAREMGLEEASIIKLASNENPLGMSPRAHAAAQQALADLARYPDGNGFALKQALVGRYGVAMDRIVLGNGSNDVLDLAARAFLTPGRDAVYAQHAFAVYPLVTKALGARGIEVPALEFGHDPFAMLGAITPETSVIFVANPNNPTGTFLDGDTLREFLDEVPGHVVVVLDEAYNEYLPPAARYDSISWLDRFPNLVITRTFSKVYGLAGLRVGFALASSDVADLMNRVRQPFNVSSVGLAAAQAALDDEEFVARSVECNTAGMRQITAGLLDLGLEFIPSYGNFVAFRVGDAARVNGALLRQGVIVRPIGGYGMPEHLRVSVGLESENARFLQSLGRALS